MTDEGLVPSKRFRGVFFDKDNDVWVVQVKLPDGEADCGSFLNEVEAAHHYDICAQQLLDNPELNFPDGE